MRNHEENVLRYRLPERFALERPDLQRLLQGRIVQLRRDAPGGKMWIKYDGKARNLADRFKHDLRIVGDCQVDARAGKRFELRRHGGQRWLLRSGKWRRCGFMLGSVS